MYKILNLTKYPATPEQIAAGIVDLPPGKIGILKRLLTFDKLPDIGDISVRAEKIADFAAEELKDLAAIMNPAPITVLIDGPPYLMSHLEKSLDARRIFCKYSYSSLTNKEVVETLPDGTLKKISSFRHEGLIHMVVDV